MCRKRKYGGTWCATRGHAWQRWRRHRQRREHEERQQHNYRRPRFVFTAWCSPAQSYLFSCFGHSVGLRITLVSTLELYSTGLHSKTRTMSSPGLTPWSHPAGLKPTRALSTALSLHKTRVHFSSDAGEYSQRCAHVVCTVACTPLRHSLESCVLH